MGFDYKEAENKQQSTGMKSLDSGPQSQTSKVRIPELLTPAVEPQACGLPSLCLGFFAYKMGMIIVPSLLGCSGDQMSLCR